MSSSHELYVPELVSYAWLFSQVHAKVDNLARFMSADQRLSITDASLASNGFLGTWVLLRQTTPVLLTIFSYFLWLAVVQKFSLVYAAKQVPLTLTHAILLTIVSKVTNKYHFRNSWLFIWKSIQKQIYRLLYHATFSRSVVYFEARVLFFGTEFSNV